MGFTPEGTRDSERRRFDEDYAFMKDRVVDNLFKIKGPAVKAHVWVIIRQEELARNPKVA